MAVNSRKSSAIEEATKRLAGLTTIDPTAKLDLGNGHTIKSYQEAAAAAATELDTYNKLYNALAAQKNRLEAAETLLKKKSKAMLAAAKLKFGEDSSEYEQCGGTRESEIKRAGRKPAAPKPTA